MRLIKSSLAGLVLAGILAVMPAAAFAHGGGGGHGGGGFRGGGGFHRGGRFGAFHGGRFGDFHAGRFGDFHHHRRFFVSGFYGYPWWGDWGYPNYWGYPYYP
jgi:hypothetical protein